MGNRKAVSCSAGWKTFPCISVTWDASSQRSHGGRCKLGLLPPRTLPTCLPDAGMGSASESTQLRDAPNTEFNKYEN